MMMNLNNKIIKVANENSNKIAVINSGGKIITYSTLMEKANIFAKELVDKNIQKNEVVAIITKKNIEMIACVLGVLKAGATYLLIDESSPKDKKNYIIDDANPKIIFSDDNIGDRANTLCIKEIYRKKITENVNVDRNEQDATYIVYTSGSSGKQKGVIVEDRNIVNYISSYIKYFNITSDDKIIQQSPIYYDGFAEEVFSMLFVGGTIVIPDNAEAYNFRLIAKIINEKKVTIVPTTPMIINEFNKMNKFKTVRAFICSGDILSYGNYDNLIGYTNVYNMYGTTETTVCATVCKCIENEKNISVGKPLDGYEVYISGEKMEKLEENEIGEVVIAGKGVARGYLNANPYQKSNFKTANGVRCYFTGDYGYMNNREVYIIGRKDRQVKINANRINLNEIEKQVLAIEDITMAACISKKNEIGRDIIVIYFVSEKVYEEELKAYCTEKIPNYIKPIYFVKVDKLPVTDTGKVNYVQLEKMYDLDSRVLEVDEIVQIIEDYFTYLEIQNIDIKMQLDSLTFMRLIVELESKFDVEFEDEYLDNTRFNDIKDICDYIQGRRNEQ